jgi:hypothetical protein
MTPQEAVDERLDMPAVRAWILSASNSELNQFIARVPASHNYFRFAADERNRREMHKIFWLTAISAVAAVVAAVLGLIALPRACSRERLDAPLSGDSRAPSQESEESPQESPPKGTIAPPLS